jgi:DNA mismatch repair ATPase MutS
MINDEYTYQLSDGKSIVKGGINVLKAMDYPDSIIQDATDYINKL